MEATEAVAKTTGNAVMDVINVAGGIDNDIGRGLAETALMIPAAGVAVVGAVVTGVTCVVEAPIRAVTSLFK